jgi:hypothetical protein
VVAPIGTDLSVPTQGTRKGYHYHTPLALRALCASSQTKRTAGMVGIPLAGILRRGWGSSVPCGYPAAGLGRIGSLKSAPIVVALGRRGTARPAITECVKQLYLGSRCQGRV